jgi:hypothetical protein
MMPQMTYDQAEAEQRQFCRERNIEFFPVKGSSKLGFALTTLGLTPLNGLRHPEAADTNGWYLWAGEVRSEADDFFSPLHTDHLLEICPEALTFLGLPPGYRFLKAGDYLDIWFDASLLDI